MVEQSRFYSSLYAKSREMFVPCPVSPGSRTYSTQHGLRNLHSSLQHTNPEMVQDLQEEAYGGCEESGCTVVESSRKRRKAMAHVRIEYCGM
jgi:hypothetical protein